MKVCSWNIAGGHTLKSNNSSPLTYDQEDLPYFIGKLRDTQSDIITLQEIHASKSANSKPQSDIIAQDLGFHTTKYNSC